ncbi:MAG: RusA family crossover junction endodeoxyribonuclease [Pseudomonadota bacterium]
MQVTVTLPFPVSVNGMYANSKSGRHKTQRYADWELEAGLLLNRQRPEKVRGPVSLFYEVQDRSDEPHRRDIGNTEKGVTDLLVKHGVIEGDHDRIVRKITMVWSSKVTGVRVTISPAQGTDHV